MSLEANRRIAKLAADRAVHRAFAWLHLHEPRMRAWQCELVGVPAPTFAEGARAAWFVQAFEQMGLRRVHVDPAGNALGELRGKDASEDGPVVLLSAHLDTVFPAGTDVAVREDEDGRLWGPGVCDNGAGLTALLGLGAAIADAGIVPGATVLFAANTGEEGEGDLRGMRELFGASRYAARIRAAIALEGAGEATVIDRALGSRRLRVTVTGPGGHSWADAGRPNAILALAAGVSALETLRMPSTPRTTLNVGTISGGNSVNSIPAVATADLDLRSASAMEIDRLELAILRTLTNAMVGREGLRLSAERIGDRPTGMLDKATMLAGSLKAVDRHLGLVTESRLGSTDANLPLSRGVPALAIGCGGVAAGIHTLEEWYDPRGREVALRRILLLLLDTCAVVGGRSLQTR